MNRAEEIKYIADTLLVERLYLMNAALTKQADLVSVVKEGLGGAAEAVTSYIKQNVDMSSTKNAVLSLFEILTPTILFRLNPLLGILAEAFGGVSFIDSVINKFKDPIISKVNSGQPIEASDIHNTAMSLMSPEGNSADDGFADVRKLANEGKLLKSAQSWRGFIPGKADFVSPKNTGAMTRIMPFLGTRAKGGNLIVALIAWVFKTALISIGLIGVSGAIKSMIGGGGEAKPTEQKPETPATTQMVSLPAAKPVSFAPSGLGEQFHPNDANHSWVVPLNGNIKNTLINWTTSVYPELKGRESDISQLPSFNRMANILSGYYDSKYPSYLVMPSGINKIIDVVNSFAGDLKKETNAIIS